MSELNDLVTWLRDQLDDDELGARAVEGNGSWDVPSTGVVQLGGVKDMEGLVPTSRNVAYHMAEHDPARVLAEVAAKRRILDAAEGAFVYAEEDRSSEVKWADESTYRWILAVLALPYADRPGYREEWRPTDT